MREGFLCFPNSIKCSSYTPHPPLFLLPSSPFISLSPLIKWTISPSNHLLLPVPMAIPSFYATAPPPPPPLTSSVSAKPNSVSTNFTTIGLGYAIAIAFGFLVLFSTVLLASYICCRSIAARRRRRDAEAGYRNSHPDDNGVYLPRIIFVAEDEEEEENDGVSGQNGLEQAVINSYPKLVYSKTRSGGATGNDSLCSICLCEYKDSEMLRMLPDCKHYFHVTCIDAWLKLNASCPVCRNSPLPTPLSTPLSEVVPLSHYSDGRRRQ